MTNAGKSVKIITNRTVDVTGLKRALHVLPRYVNEDTEKGEYIDEKQSCNDQP